jgi:ATP-dependent DNA helicase RecG
MTDNEYIESLLKEPEGPQTAFFEDFNYDKIAETVCAFLNSSGGRIIIGVNYSHEVIFTLPVENQFLELRKQIYSSILPESLVGIREENYNNRYLVLIEVIEGAKKPYSIKNRSFIRSNTETKLADNSDMSNLIRSRRKEEYSWENSPMLDATMEDLDMEEISKAIELCNQIGRTSRFKADEPELFLTHFQLSRNGQLTNASVVLFGKEPSYFLPQCRVRIIFFGNSKSADEFRDTLIVENNLFRSFRRIQDYFKKNLPMQSQFTDEDWQRKDRPKYPLKALDEAVINAMMHRDYSDPTGEVLIGIYFNKIEITNSGELPEGLKDIDLKKSHRSIPPNPVITHIVYLCGMIEKIGRGTILISELFEEYGLDAPKWESKNGGTILILPGTPKIFDLSDRMLSFLHQVKPGDYFSREDYEIFFETKGKISEKTARNDINKLLTD